MKKDKKIALIIMFIVGLILIMVAIEYDNNTTAEKIRNEREKIEARLEIAKLKDSIENKKD
jgi:CHASE3 domain sensor protein